LRLEDDQGAPHELAVRIRPTPIHLSPPPVDLLLVHGDTDVQNELSSSLSAAGHEVSTSSSVDGTIRMLRDDTFEVVVLSLDAAGVGGAEVVARLRAVSDVALIMMGRDGTAGVRDTVFDSGADAYLMEPVDPTELDRLVRARARRATARQHGNELTGPADITMQVRVHEVLVGSELLALTPKEFSILRLFLEHRGEVVETDGISQSVWGHETYGSRNFVEAHISRLRQKLIRVGAGRSFRPFVGSGTWFASESRRSG
jgi:two-component system response regulator MprA